MALRHLSARGLIGVLAAGLLVVGCTPDPGPNPTASPTGGPSASPTASPTPTRTETAEEQKQRVAFEAAEKAYRTNFAEVGRLAMAGGADKPTPLLRATARGEYLESSMLSLQSIRENGLKASSPGSISWARHKAFSPDEVVLESCENYRKSVLRDRSGKVFTPEGSRIYAQTITVQKAKDDWKLSSKETTEVEKC